MRLRWAPTALATRLVNWAMATRYGQTAWRKGGFFYLVRLERGANGRRRPGRFLHAMGESSPRCRFSRHIRTISGLCGGAHIEALRLSSI